MSTELLASVSKYGVGSVIALILMIQNSSYLPNISSKVDHQAEKDEAYHDSILKEGKLTNHFLWAQCVNNALNLPNRNDQRIATERCQPPLEKMPRQQASIHSVEHLEIEGQSSGSSSSSSGSTLSPTSL